MKIWFDGSQASSLMNLNSCKEMLLMMAGMGFNLAMLYCEDSFELEGEPYWGNVRPKYTKQDFKEADDFAYFLGIEMIPCVQTLGHLTEAIKRVPYQKISDTESVLMLFAEHMYAYAPDKERLKRRFQVCTQMSWDAFMDINALDAMPEYNGEEVRDMSLTHAFIWQDIMLGLCDGDIAEIFRYDHESHYRKLQSRFQNYAAEYPKHREMFEFQYLEGSLEKLDELEEERLSLSGENKLGEVLWYRMICSASSL